jgi:pimeloyl-ACP methyl ester carboxylesterase
MTLVTSPVPQEWYDDAIARPTGFHPALRTTLREELSVLSVGRRLITHRRPEAQVDPERIPTLLIPGFLSGDFALLSLTDELRSRGHWACGARISPNTGCTQEMADAVEARLVSIAERTGHQVAIVGWSRGGTLGKLIAMRRPDLVASLITLATPNLDPLAVNATLAFQLQVLTVLQSIGVPGVMGADCITGECARQVRDQLRADFPRTVPYLSVYSTTDGVIDWRACLDPEAEQREVDATHMAIGADPAVISLVVERLSGTATAIPG